MTRNDSVTINNEIPLVDRNPSIGTWTEIGANEISRQDQQKLARMGKKEVLKRRFGLISLFGFSCCILITWETALALFNEAFINGGPAALSWGFLIAWACSMSVYMCLAEMASIAPIAGGQYFWVSILAPLRYKRFLSYVTGWLTSLAWVSTLAVGCLFTGTIIQGIITLNYPDYEAQPWQGTLLAWAVIAVGVFVNTIIAGLLPFLEGLILMLHILGFIAILVTTVYLSPHVGSKEVFFTTLNEGNWPTQGLSFCVGFIGNVATFVGADAAVHMSEEIENAAINVPRAIFITLILNGATGWAMLLAVLFTLNNIDRVLDSPTGFPFLQLLYDGTGLTGATVMASIVVVLIWCATIGFLATASRMVWSFARDRGIPFHRLISKVDPKSKVPVYSVILVTVIPCLLTLIYIGSTVAYNDVVSLSVSGLYASYFIPCSLLFWRRVTGQIKPRGYTSAPGFADPSKHNLDQNSNQNKDQAHSQTQMSDDQDNVLTEPIIEWGPWRVPGVFGTVNNGFACVYCIWVLFWDFWPPATPVTPATMNYSVLVTGVVILFSIAYYYIWGKSQYLGPLIDYEVKGIANRYIVVRDKE